MRLIFVFIILALSSFAFADNKLTYPERAWQLHKSGEVKLVYNINGYGNVENIRLVKEDPKGFFERGIRSQMDNWKFQKGNPRKDIKLSVKFIYPETR